MSGLFKEDPNIRYAQLTRNGWTAISARTFFVGGIPGTRAYAFLCALSRHDATQLFPGKDTPKPWIAANLFDPKYADFKDAQLTERLYRGIGDYAEERLRELALDNHPLPRKLTGLLDDMRQPSTRKLADEAAAR